MCVEIRHVPPWAFSVLIRTFLSFFQSYDKSVEAEQTLKIFIFLDRQGPCLWKTAPELHGRGTKTGSASQGLSLHLPEEAGSSTDYLHGSGEVFGTSRFSFFVYGGDDSSHI